MIDNFYNQDFFLLAEREEERLHSETQRLETELFELKERKNLYEVCYSKLKGHNFCTVLNIHF